MGILNLQIYVDDMFNGVCVVDTFVVLLRLYDDIAYGQ